MGERGARAVRVVERALRAARERYLELVERGEASKKMGRGAYGDLSYLPDVACEEVIMEAVKEELGDVTFVSEEKGYVEASSEYLVLIDPVDGSTNMYRGIRFFSAGMAIAKGRHYSEVFAAGVIDFPSGEVTVACDSKVYGSDARLSDVRELSEAVMTIDPRALKYRETSEQYVELMKSTKHVRFLGSALLELLNVFKGSSDGFVCLSRELRVMDFIPALYILESVGVKALVDPGPLETVRLDGRERYGVIVCATKELLMQVLRTTGRKDIIESL